MGIQSGQERAEDEDGISSAQGRAPAHPGDRRHCDSLHSAHFQSTGAPVSKEFGQKMAEKVALRVGVEG